MARFNKVPLFLGLVAALLFSGVTPIHPASPTRLVLIGKLDGPPLPAGLNVVEDYTTYVLAEIDEQDLPALQARYNVDPLADRTQVSINGTVFDTAQPIPAVAADLHSPPGDPYYLVQFYGPPKAEWQSALEQLGVVFLGYHPTFTYLVRLDPARLAAVRAAHAVQAVVPYHPAYRLAPPAEMDRALAHDGRIALQVRSFVGENAAELRRQLEAAGATVEFVSDTDPPQARAWAARELLPHLAALPAVYRVEPYVPPVLHNERAAQVTHTWDAWRASRNGLLQDLMGAGQVAGLVDSGLDDNDTTPLINDFYDYTGGSQTTRIAAAIPGDGCGGLCSCYTEDNANSSGHGTHVAGSIAGNGYNALAQRGLTAQARDADPYFDYGWGVGQAPEARIAFAHVAGSYLFQQGTLCGIGTAYNTWEDLYNQGARNANNSWGASTTTYGGDALDADEVMWTYQDYLVVASASNDGPDWNTVGQPGTAKNIITVGAAGNHRSVWGLTSDSATLLTDFSSRGPVNPTTDNRAKPDVVAPGADVLSTRSTFIANDTVTLWANEPGDGDADGHLDYWWSGGTSMSSPLVTGAATVVRDYFQDIQGLGTTTPPSAALIKAALLNGAVDMGYGYESFTAAPYGGRNIQGWGMVNVEQSITPRAPRSFFYDDFTNITNTGHQSTVGCVQNGPAKTYTVAVTDASEPLKTTLTWTDYQDGNDGFAVDNLDLVVTAPGGAVYNGNVFSGSWSTTGGTADTRNNTEAVYIQNPAVGTWTVRVNCTMINRDTTQPYALFVSGGFGPNPAYTVGDTAGRDGDSAQAYFPSLKPLAGTEEHTAPGGSFTTYFRVTNWGTTADQISLSAAATDMSGGSAAGIGVVFSPAGPFNLASGASQDVQAAISVGAAVANGPYDVTFTAASGNSTRRDAMVVGLNVVPATTLSNETRVVLDGSAQFALDFWGTGQTLWAAYLSAESHNNSEAEVWTARSTDGGQTWTKMGQVDANDGRYYYGPAIAGNAAGTSVTVVWHPANSTAMYARTWTSGGGWGATRTLASYTGYYIADPDVIYDGDGHILAVWLAYNTVSSATAGIFSSRSTDNGATWSAAAAVPDASATDTTHRWPALALDTARNDVWLAYAHRIDGTNRDIRLKRWDGDTNAWDAAGTRHIAVAATGEREIHPAIAYIAATDALWVTWIRYPNYASPTPRLYYARSSGTLPDPTFPTTYGPYATRAAEPYPAPVTGDGGYAYIAYLAYSDGFRGGNVYLLRVPAAGGAPDSTRQLCATVDDPPLYARGNAGSPRLLWLSTTVNGQTLSGPTLLYSKNPPNSGSPDYGGNLGVAQTLFNLGENIDLYLMQAGNPPTAVDLVRFEARPAGEGIRVEWETAGEVDVAGFDLFRAAAAAGPYVRLNDALIPDRQPGSPLGAAYAWDDTDVGPGPAYYKLDVVDANGTAVTHGPVWAVAGPVYRSHLPLVIK